MDMAYEQLLSTEINDKEEYRCVIIKWRLYAVEDRKYDDE